MTTTRYSDAGQSGLNTNVWVAREMLKHAGPVCVLEKFGLSKQMPKNKKETIQFKRPRVFTAATTPLVEGITPAATSFAYEAVSVALRQYGQVVEITDWIEEVAEDPVLQDASIQCGENIGRTVEALMYGVLKAGTNVFYTNGTARTSVNTPITLAAQRAVVRALQAQKAMMITNILDASPNYGTRAIEASYVAVCHTDMESDIRGLPGFTPVAEYGSRKVIVPQELGTVENVRYVASPDLGSIIDAGGTKSGSGTTMVSTSGTSADVYPILYFGKEAFGGVALKGYGSVEPSIIPVNQKTKDDVLGQRGYVGWKTWWAGLILNQAWMARLESAATAL